MIKDQPNPPKDPIDLPLDEYYDEYVDEYSEDGLRDVLGEEGPAARLPGARTIFKPRERRPSFLLAVLINAFRLIVLSVLVLSLAGVGAVVGVARAYMDTAPELDLTVIDDQAQTSFIYDAEGREITDYKGTENRVMVSIDTIPLTLRNAFVAVEDARFYTHNGVDLKRIAGAFLNNFVTGSQQGGSTITQQLIKNTLLSSEQSYKRKIQEAYLAMQLETRYTKEQILESYLNTIYLGENYYGVKTAAYGFFGRDSLSDMTLRECAMLAGVTTNPYYYNPRRNYYLRESETTDYPAITDRRTDYVLKCMYENQFISRAQYEEALDPSTARVLSKSPESNEIYPYAYYVEYAIRDVIQALLKIHGLENTPQNRNRMDSELRTGGYQVFLALDPDIQQAVEEIVYNYQDYPALNNSADSVYRARNADGTYEEIVQPQAAVVVTDYRTGEIKAIVGSRTKPNRRKTLNRAADMNMPVGSAVKPLSVYAPAIELGHGAADIVNNMPIPVAGWRDSSGEDTWPRNYGGSSYRGPETMRTALTRSDNTAAAYALMNFVGVDRSYDYLLRLGVSPDHINKTPFGLALGSSGISCIEMAMAFGALGNGGVYRSPITFKGLFDSDRRSLFDAGANQVQRQVFKPSTAWLTVDMLKDAVTSGTGTAAKVPGQTVAGKTGTNSDQRGVFFAGMTGWYCGAVWIGHDNYKPLSSKTTGGNSAARLWQAVMARIHSDKNLRDRDILQGSAEEYGLVKVTTCAVSGQLATEACYADHMGYGTKTDWWPADALPRVYCQLHVQQVICADSGMLAGPYCENTRTAGVVSLPYGHPLEKYIGTEYQGILEDYLGSTVSGSVLCTWHSAPPSPEPDPYDPQGGDPYAGYDPYDGYDSYDDYLDPGADGASSLESLEAGAWDLVQSATQQLGWMEENSQGYLLLVDAIQNLVMQLNAGAGADALAAAMSELTQAMNGY